jgi:hypothetical protein
MASGGCLNRSSRRACGILTYQRLALSTLVAVNSTCRKLGVENGIS